LSLVGGHNNQSFAALLEMPGGLLGVTAVRFEPMQQKPALEAAGVTKTFGRHIRRTW
jgi:hypothetical protein